MAARKGHVAVLEVLAESAPSPRAGKLVLGLVLGCIGLKNAVRIQWMESFAGPGLFASGDKSRPVQLATATVGRYEAIHETDAKGDNAAHFAASEGHADAVRFTATQAHSRWDIDITCEH